MIDEELALLRAAAADPDDDTLRLAYADWLDEQSGEAFSTHAAFVRLQVRRSRLDVFDPDRTTLLDEEAALSWKYRRDWNGRIHQRLRLLGLPGKVDARHGLIRGWSYHRGMVAHVAVSATALATYPEMIFSLGPIESIRLVGWPTEGWVKETASIIAKLLPRLKVLAVVGIQSNAPLPDLAQLTTLGLVPLLDLRSMACGHRANQLLELAQTGTISPTVLLLRTTITTQPGTRGRFAERSARDDVHVIDPFGQWNRLRFWHGDLTGKVLSPVHYQRTGR
ncbi:MAG: hypothetical protein C0467_24390 [Planctomycetaceae bacterium]|nr:hypothetical protein [Planctomycetaceae bacterium]